MSWCVLRGDETEVATPGASTPGHSVAPSVADEDFHSVAGETVASFSLVDGPDIAALDSLSAIGDFAATSGEEFAEPRVDATDTPDAPTEMAPKAAPGNSASIMPWPWPYSTGPQTAVAPPPTRLWQIPDNLPTEPPDVLLEASASTLGEPLSLPAMPQRPRSLRTPRRHSRRR